MDCPKCHAPMEPVGVGGYEVERCAVCAGMWFDLHEHEHVAEHAADVRRVDTGNASRGREYDRIREVACPCCRVKMLTLAVPQQGHIHYESCPVCHGAFFDAGEFRDYAHLSVGERVGGFLRGFQRRAATRN